VKGGGRGFLHRHVEVEAGGGAEAVDRARDVAPPWKLVCSCPSVVQDALRDLELIRAAGIEGLESVFELLEEALCH
jgi:hypothetical protein